MCPSAVNGDYPLTYAILSPLTLHIANVSRFLKTKLIKLSPILTTSLLTAFHSGGWNNEGPWRQGKVVPSHDQLMAELKSNDNPSWHGVRPTQKLLQWLEVRAKAKPNFSHFGRKISLDFSRARR